MKDNLTAKHNHNKGGRHMVAKDRPRQSNRDLMDEAFDTFFQEELSITRINCVPVETLSNEHLMAEYKESTRPFNKVIAHLDKGRKAPTLDGAYRLGKGHETFFFNKLFWLHLRRTDLLQELIKRGFNIDKYKFTEIALDFKNRLGHTEYWDDWTPTSEDIYTNMARLCHRHFKTDLSEFN